MYNYRYREKEGAHLRHFRIDSGHRSDEKNDRLIVG